MIHMYQESGFRQRILHLRFGSWDVVRELCLEMFNGRTAVEATEGIQ